MKRLIRIAMALLALPPLSAPALTLEDCVQTALAANPDLRAAEQRVVAARAALQQANAASFPLARASAAYTRTDNPPQAFMMTLNQRRLSLDSNFNEPDDTENLRLSVGATYRLFDGGQRSMDKSAARAGAEARRFARDAALNNLLHEVAASFYAVLRARSFISIHEGATRSIEESLRAARERFESGAAVKSDVLSLEARLAESREDVIRARNAHRLAIVALNTAIGDDLVVETTPLNGGPDTAPPLELTDDTDIKDRPEWKAARATTRAAESLWRKAVRAYAPVVNAFGSVDWDSDVSSDFEQSYFMGVAADVDIFDGYRKRGAAAEARAEWMAAQAEETRMRNALRSDLIHARLQAAEARERVEVSAQSVGSAEEAFRITQERFTEGGADLAELLNAQAGLTAARSRRVAAHYDYLTALSNWQRATGKLADKWHGEPPLKSTQPGDD